jgi:hypothetical protein
MSVKELIEQLQSLDQELEVFVHGYEGGYESITSISEPQDFILNWNTEFYYGPHEKLKELQVYNIELQEKHKIVKGIVL